jgi:hypothetical protein
LNLISAEMASHLCRDAREEMRSEMGHTEMRRDGSSPPKAEMRCTSKGDEKRRQRREEPHLCLWISGRDEMPCFARTRDSKASHLFSAFASLAEMEIREEMRKPYPSLRDLCVTHLLSLAEICDPTASLCRDGISSLPLAEECLAHLWRCERQRCRDAEMRC